MNSATTASTPWCRRVEHLRRKLVVAGLLPAHHHALGLFDRWVRQFIVTVPDGADRQIIATYATWYHRRRLSAAVDNDNVRVSSPRAARRCIRVAIEFLASLSRRNTRRGACPQADLDHWFSHGPTTRVSAIGFVMWARTQRLCRAELRVPITTTATPDAMPHDKRVELVSRLLNNEEIDLSDPVAGLLVALYAQPVTRVSCLRHDAIVDAADHVLVRFGHELIELPAPFDGLVRRLLVNGSNTDGGWLFPGITPGQCVSSHGLGERIRRHGVTKAVRVAAFHDLVQKVPSPVLATLIGYNPSVIAVRASALAAEWTTYAALRAGVPATPATAPSRSAKLLG